MFWLTVSNSFSRLKKTSTSKFAIFKSALYIFNKRGDSMNSREIFDENQTVYSRVFFYLQQIEWFDYTLVSK